MLATSATLYLESFLGAICELPLQLFFCSFAKTYDEKGGGQFVFSIIHSLKFLG
jgi:hypothetical protein